RLFARDERMPHPHPCGGRPGIDELAGDESVLHRGVVANRLAGGEERDGATLVRTRWRRAGAQQSCPGIVAVPLDLALEPEIGGGEPPRPGPDHLAALVG